MDTVDADSGFRDRWYAETLRKKLARPFVHILFGARQTGKSTLLNTLLPSNSLCVNLAIPRLECEKPLGDRTDQLLSRTGRVPNSG